MAKYLINQNTFQHGEVSPKTKGRRDLEEYKNSLDILENFIVSPQGGVVKRPGARFLVDTAFTIGSTNTPRIIPFIFSKDEKYVVVLGPVGSSREILMFREDGTIIVPSSNFAIFPDGNYDPSGWQFAQSGDVLVLAYNDPNSDGNFNTPPMFIVRTAKDAFQVFSLSHPTFPGFIPSKMRFNYAVHRPYLPPNFDSGIKLHTAGTVSFGTNREIFAVDQAGTSSVPLFGPGHVFKDNGSRGTQIGGFFRVTKASSTGVCYVTSLRVNETEIVPPGNINTGTDQLTISLHSYLTGDIVRIASVGAGTDAVITGVTLGDNTDFYVRNITANTITLHPTRADALASTNRLDFTSTGTGGVRVLAHLHASANITIEVAFEASLTSAGNATDNWEESAWSAHQGFPQTVSFHESRLAFGGTVRNPDTVWFSQAGNIVNFMARKLDQNTSSPTAAAVTQSKLNFILSGDLVNDFPTSVTLASTEANGIQWMYSQDVLSVGTKGAEYIITGGDKPLGPESTVGNIIIKRQTTYGSNGVQAISAGSSILYITRDGRKIRDFKFNNDNGSFISTNASFLSDHMVFRQRSIGTSTTLKGSTYKQAVYQSGRECVWLITSNRELVGMTLSKEAGIVAWHFHPAPTGMEFVSVGVLPDDNDTFDNLFVMVRNTSNDAFYLCKIGDDFEHEFLGNTSSDDNDVPFYSDVSQKQVLISATNTISGFSHLNGLTVQVIVDGVREADKVVSAGSITLDAVHPIGTVVVYGLQYTSKLQTLDIEGGGFFGTSESTRQRQDRIALRLNKSHGGEYGNSSQSVLFSIDYVDPSGSPSTEQFTGIKRLDFEITPDMENKVLIRHDEPLPFSLLSITHRGVSYE